MVLAHHERPGTRSEIRRTVRLGRDRPARAIPQLPSRPHQTLLANHPEARWELTWLYRLWTITYLTSRSAPKRRRRLARPLDTRPNPSAKPDHGPLQQASHAPLCLLSKNVAGRQGLPAGGYGASAHQ